MPSSVSVPVVSVTRRLENVSARLVDLDTIVLNVRRLPVLLILFVLSFVAEWLGSRTCDQQVAGSNPGRRAVECNPGQVVYTHVPLSASSIIWYQPVGADARRLGR